MQQVLQREEESAVLNLKSDNISLTERLRIAEEQVSLQENALINANAEIQDQRSIIEQSQRIIDLHQENCQKWIELSEYYQLKCSQSANFLSQMVVFLQGNTSDWS